MKIYLATDHAGIELKNQVKQFLTERGYDLIDYGAAVFDPNDDYPDFIAKAAEAVSADPENSRALIFGGSGQGEAIVANKLKNVRAAVYYGGNESIVELSRQHNNANVLSIGARFVSFEEARKVIELWLGTEFTNEERHTRRIDKIKQIENKT